MTACDLRDEFVGCDFGDARLSSRIIEMANVFQDNPGRSIPSAFVTRADWEACYRFFDNDSVKPGLIIQPHIEATYERLKERNVALFVQDTTELDLTRPKQQVQGAGPMDCESRRGAFMHPLIAFDSDGVPLGLAGLQHWTRDEISHASPAKKKSTREHTPIEKKESNRWLVGLQQTKDASIACPQTKCICIGDSESDIYELYALTQTLQAEHSNLHLLVRAGQDRATEHGLWTQVARMAPLVATQTIHIRARTAKVDINRSSRAKSREARSAEVQIRAGTVEVHRPDHLNHLPRKLRLNVVLVEETDCPEGEDPIRWLLVTTLPIDTEELIQTIIRYYCLRWQIEVYFRTLKSGCRVEYRRFENVDRLMNCVTLLAVVAWRVMYITYIGRNCPDMDCEAVFEPSEWKSVYAILRREIPIKGCPKLQDIVRAIAMLGGFVDRPSNHPGTQSLWIGLQRCYDLSNAWDTFGPGRKKISTA